MIHAIVQPHLLSLGDIALYGNGQGIRVAPTSSWIRSLK